MAFSMVGGVMLLLVLIFYFRMVDNRNSARQRKSQVQHWLEKAEVFESVADDKNALKTLEQALAAHPEEPDLLEKAKSVRLRLAQEDH
ncbi:hypothetical protein QWZ13_18950 [Reinekea marina]|uniref:Tetratricopeptide repeat protein n=1 Tax=Reinekea marina TaxID=1310421 RepID=A0ABV7WTQ6_9GAMM|nr:hypothetical protein [Reinekea marina]MBU2864109.1 hypothetical protein [Reinekea forsetii]MDN3650992.1 hypothetical protein [Reinekea marina]